eukprot:EG_transcript_67141
MTVKYNGIPQWGQGKEGQSGWKGDPPSCAHLLSPKQWHSQRNWFLAQIRAPKMHFGDFQGFGLQRRRGKKMAALGGFWGVPLVVGSDTCRSRAGEGVWEHPPKP